MSLGSVPSSSPRQSQSSFLAIVSFYSEILHQDCNKSPSVSRLRFCLLICDDCSIYRQRHKQPWQVTGVSRTSCFVVLIDGQHINACRDGYMQASARARAIRNTLEEKLALKHHTQAPPCRNSHTYAAPYLWRRKTWVIQLDSPCLVCIFHTEQQGGIKAQQCRL